MAILPPQKHRLIAPLLAGLVFALLSIAVLPYPGLQDDEVFFSVPIYVHGSAISNTHLFGQIVPLMLLSYLGTLKTWIYAAILHFVLPSICSVRLPMVAMGVVTVWLTWAWVSRAAGTRAAAFTVALLATDSMFILTNTFDWGPVALQHTLLVGGLLATQLWLQRDPDRREWKLLALAFFLWGVGLWDKALMIWPLIGLMLAAIVVYPREFRRTLRRNSIAIATAAFLLGALPLVYFNMKSGGQTASANRKLSVASLDNNLTVLTRTVDGSILRDTLVATTPGPSSRTAVTLKERFSFGLEELLGTHESSFMIPALTLALICLPFVPAPSRRFLIFLLVAAAVTWLQMATNAGTGGSAHHVILLWPLPAAFVGIALAAIAERLPRPAIHALTATIALIACGNALNTNHYLANLIRNGAPTPWTDATSRLAGAISHYRSSQILTVDWGYINGLRMLYAGDLKITALDSFPEKIQATIQTPNSIFIQHTDDKQLFPGVNEKLRAAALAIGYSEELLRVVHDNEGRQVFEIFRFRKTAR